MNLEIVKKRPSNKNGYINRKDFIGLTTKAIAVAALPPIVKLAATKHKIKAVAFDAYTLFDTNSILQVAEELFPGK